MYVYTYSSFCYKEVNHVHEAVILTSWFHAHGESVFKGNWYDSIGECLKLYKNT